VCCETASLRPVAFVRAIDERDLAVDRLFLSEMIS